MRVKPGLSQRVISRGGIRPAGETWDFFGYKFLNECLIGRRKLSLTGMQRIELVVGPILVGLNVERTVITDPDLRRRFPNTVGELPPPPETDDNATRGDAVAQEQVPTPPAKAPRTAGENRLSPSQPRRTNQ